MPKGYLLDQYVVMGRLKTINFTDGVVSTAVTIPIHFAPKGALVRCRVAGIIAFNGTTPTLSLGTIVAGALTVNALMGTGTAAATIAAGSGATVEGTIAIMTTAETTLVAVLTLPASGTTTGQVVVEFSYTCPPDPVDDVSQP